MESADKQQFNPSASDGSKGKNQKKVLYLASNPSLVGCMKFTGVSKEKTLRFFPNITYPLDASPLLKEISRDEIKRVTEWSSHRDNGEGDGEYDLRPFFDAIQSTWDKVVVWREDKMEDELLMMLIAKYATRNTYPLYEVVLGSSLSTVYPNPNQITDTNRNIENVASLLTSERLDVLAGRYDCLLEHDTGMRIRNDAGEIVNVDLDYFAPMVISLLEESAKENKTDFGYILFNLGMKGLTYFLGHKVLFEMQKEGLLHIQNKKTGKEINDTATFWQIRHSNSGQEIIVVR